MLALPGLRHSAESVSQAGQVLSLVFLSVLACFLITSLVAALIHWLNRRSEERFSMRRPPLRLIMQQKWIARLVAIGSVWPKRIVEPRNLIRRATACNSFRRYTTKLAGRSRCN